MVNDSFTSFKKKYGKNYKKIIFMKMGTQITDRILLTEIKIYDFHKLNDSCHFSSSKKLRKEKICVVIKDGDCKCFVF